MKELRRIQVGELNIEKAVTIDDLRKNENLLSEKLITIEEIFKNKEKIDLNNKQLGLFLNGVMLTNSNQEGLYLIYNDNKFIGLGMIKNNLLKRDVII